MSIRNPEAVVSAVREMGAGHLVVVPTDTIYGIATSLTGESAVQRLYEARGREREPALPFLVADVSLTALLAHPDAAALRLAHRFWPGPLTLILPPASDLPAYARTTPVAVRIANFPTLLPLLLQAGGMLLVSGAIKGGHPPAITAQEAASLFGGSVSLVLNGGPSPYGVPSTIVNCVVDPPVIVRHGAIADHKIWEALGLAHLGGPHSDP